MASHSNIHRVRMKGHRAVICSFMGGIAIWTPLRFCVQKRLLALDDVSSKLHASVSCMRRRCSEVRLYRFPFDSRINRVPAPRRDQGWGIPRCVGCPPLVRRTNLVASLATIVHIRWSRNRTHTANPPADSSVGCLGQF